MSEDIINQGLSESVLTFIHTLSLLKSCYVCAAKWPQQIWEKPHSIKWAFYQMAWEPQCEEHSFSCCFHSPLWFWLRWWWQGRATLNSRLPRGRICCIWNCMSSMRHANVVPCLWSMRTATKPMSQSAWLIPVMSLNINAELHDPIIFWTNQNITAKW